MSVEGLNNKDMSKILKTKGKSKIIETESRSIRLKTEGMSKRLKTEGKTGIKGVTVEDLGLTVQLDSLLGKHVSSSSPLSNNSMRDYFASNRYIFAKLPVHFSKIKDVSITLSMESGKGVYLLTLPDKHIGILVPDCKENEHHIKEWGIKTSDIDLSSISFSDLFDNNCVTKGKKLTGDFGRTAPDFLETCKKNGIDNVLLTYQYDWNKHLPAGLTFELLADDDSNYLDYDVADLSDLPYILSSINNEKANIKDGNEGSKSIFNKNSSDEDFINKMTDAFNGEYVEKTIEKINNPESSGTVVGVKLTNGSILSATELEFLKDTYEIVSLVYNEERVGYRFVGKKFKLDIDTVSAKNLGLTSLKVRKRLNLVEHNGLLVSEGELKNHSLVTDVSDSPDLCKKLLESILE